MPRIFVPPHCISGGTATLPEAEAKRLMRVLRLGPGDAVTLFDGTKEYTSRIISIGTKSAILEITGTAEKHSEPPVAITLGQGMPKGEKLEWVIQKSVELGVAEVVPVLMGRSVKRPDDTGGGFKHDRLVRIATEAAQQSGRVRVPEVARQMEFSSFLEHVSGAELKLVFFEGGKAASLRDAIKAAAGVKSVAVLVGPEGGLAEEEVAMAVSHGFVVVGLGPRILRTETAGPAVLAILQYELGDMG